MSKDILQLIPHRGKMKLIDEIFSSDKENFIVSIKINKDSLMATESGVPSYCGIEYMAQSIAAFNSTHYFDESRSKVGFILAVKKYESELEYFPLDSELQVKVEPSIIVNNSGSFSCYIYYNDQKICSGRITAYVPSKDELEILKAGGSLR